MFRSYVLAVLLCSSVAWTQADPASGSTKPNPVTVVFAAWGHDKHPYADLKPDDLSILDNKQPVRSIFSLKKGSEVPLSIGLLVDASGSQRTSALYQPGLRAATDLLNQVLKGPDDRVFVVKVTAKAETSEFMSRAQFVDFKLNVTPEGGTALYDGVSLACDSWMKGGGPQTSRRVLIVLSDGDDNASHINREAAIRKALEAGVMIFPVSTAEDPPWQLAQVYAHRDIALQRFASETGGEAFLHMKQKKIEQSFAAIAEGINNVYSVTFEPATGSGKGLHRLEIKAPRKNNTRFRSPEAFYLQ